MFLSQLNNTRKGKLFLELATLVMMASVNSHHEEAESSDYNVRRILSLKNELDANHSYIAQLLNNIHSTEAQILIEYAKELDFSSGFDGLGSIFDKENLNTDDNHQKFSLYIGKIKRQRFSNIFHFIEVALGKTLMSPPIAATEDEENTPYLLRSSVKLHILKIAASELIQEKELSLTEKDKKIIITELLGAAFSSGDIETEELELIHHICLSLDLDGESLEELYEALANLYQANKTLTDLINE